VSFFYTEVAPGLIENLESVFEFTFQLGELTQPSTNTDLGCIFKPRDNPYAGDISLRQDHFVVRVILQDISLQQPSPEVALDPEPLERAAQMVLDALKPLQEIADGYFVWTRTDYHNTNRIVDVAFQTMQANQFSQGG
jgi:hypothetical protein